MKKILKTLFFVSLVFSTVFLSCATNNKSASTTQEQTNPLQSDAKPPKLYDENKILKDDGKIEFKGISAAQTVIDMKVGWNLGNTLDAPGETQWGQPLTTKEMIDTLAASGIKSIRIPVSWNIHMDSSYTVNKNWMNRVKTIVDWAIENDMYVILNCHHDNYNNPAKMPKGHGYYPNKTNYVESAKFVYNLWSQIATAFNNGYDEHLVFEVLNEPRLCGTSHEWWFDKNAAECVEAAACLNKLNQFALDAIRESGGNNQKRYVMIPALGASVDSALASAFKMPEDDEAGKLILSAHAYSPYTFAMQTPGAKSFTPALQNELAGIFKRLNDKFVTNGYPVVIGEYGATNKGNLEERVKWFDFFISDSKKYGITCFLWDNGAAEANPNQGEKFGYFDRRNLKWFFPEILDSLVKNSN
ncbi:MAG: glycoside hydrolase family 5 protein [Treponema sp.]|nr:glycoside hydrolase family 5 protein [Treponema sp.]